MKGAARELITDSFAGGGGASTGIEMALGRSPDIAVNHDPEAVAMHRMNHPEAHHYCQNIWQVDPREALKAFGPGAAIGLSWFSPDCKHFSRAKGGTPVKRNIRDLAWIVVLWAQLVRPRVICLENVPEFLTWGPLGADDRPIRERAGDDFIKWQAALKREGYKVEWRELRACDYGAPTIRKRLFIIARRDGEKIVWPEPTHGAPADPDVLAGRKLPWRTAAEILDWSLDCPSIFLTKEEGRALGVKRPLAPKTMARIARGIQRYVIEAEKPFIVSLTHAGGDRIEAVDEPVKTVTGALRGEKAVVAPVLARTAWGEADSKGRKRGRGEHGPEVPLPTVTGSPDFALVSPVLAGVGGRAGQSRERGGDEPLATITAKGDTVAVVPVITAAQHGGSTREADAPLHTVAASAKDQNQIIAATLVQSGYGEREGQAPRVPHIDKPLGTAVAGGVKHALVAAHVTKFRGGATGHGADEPLHTVTASSFIKRPGGTVPLGGVSAFLAQHNNNGPDDGNPGRAADAPLSTVTASGGQQGVVAAHMMTMKGSERRAAGAEEPLRTVTGGGMHHAEVRAFLMKYYGTGEGQDCADPVHSVTTKDRFGLVMIEGVPHEIVDIGLRMLSPRELFRAQGFRDGYIIDRGLFGTDDAPETRALTKTAQVRMCGNSVCPPLAAAIVAANVPELAVTAAKRGAA